MNTNTDEKKFIDKYGYDALKIIAAFEEAFEIDDEKRYTTWFGDYNMYETSTDDLSYQKLCKRFFAGLQYLGCGKNKEDVSAICFRRPSEELVEKMKNNRFAEKMRKTTNDRHIEKKQYNVCETIDNYNSSAYYEPSYVITRAYYNGF